MLRVVGNLHSVALIDLHRLHISTIIGWEPSFCSLDRLKNFVMDVRNGLGTFIL